MSSSALPSAPGASFPAIACWVIGALAVTTAAGMLIALRSAVVRKYSAELLEQHLFTNSKPQQPKQLSMPEAGTRRVSSNVYRILAFGDSLTEGFTGGGQFFHPYAKKLGTVLHKALVPQDLRLEVEERGESGERVLGGMVQRLQRSLADHAAAGRPCDWVLLLGGINDLAGDEAPAAEVLAGLDAMVQASLRHGAHVLLMTLMEAPVMPRQIDQQRQQLNAMIKDYVRQRQWDKQQQQQQAESAAAGSSGGQGRSNRRLRPPGSSPHVVLFDLAAALPFEAMEEQQRYDVWDDGLHLTVGGYDLMGKLVAEALLPQVQQEVAESLPLLQQQQQQEKAAVGQAATPSAAAAAVGHQQQGKKDL